MKKLRLYMYPPLFLVMTLAVCLAIYGNTRGIVLKGEMHWKEKEKEVVSRLLAVPVLLYHNIDGKGPFSVSMEVLRQQFQMIKDRNIKVIPLGKLVERLENPRPFRNRVLVITFDDGYPAMYTRLLPLAQEFNFPVTLFVYTDFITTRGKRALTWKKLREMDRSLIDIQCHTISHADLTKVSASKDPERYRKLYHEIYASKKVIELRLDKRIEYFAFPYGRYNREIISLAQDAGYTRAFSTDYGSNIITRDNYCLKRQHIKKDYSMDFFEKLIQQVR